MRAEIARNIDEYRRRNKKSDILWRGIPYIDICKVEKLMVETKMKDEIREEIENRKFNRGTGVSTYVKFLN
jgi:hypothetical protein